MVKGSYRLCNNCLVPYIQAYCLVPTVVFPVSELLLKEAIVTIKSLFPFVLATVVFLGFLLEC